MPAKTSALEMALMGLLLQGPRSGYDLRKTFATTAWRHYSDSPGSIYPALRRLQGRGWIKTAGASSAQDPRKRQEYRPTPAGKSAFAHWLSQPLTTDSVRFDRPELMLRFAFMDGNVPRIVAITFLEQLIEEMSAHLGELREQRAAMRLKAGAAGVHTGLLAFEAGVVGTESQLAWAQKARIRLQNANRKS